MHLRKEGGEEGKGAGRESELGREGRREARDRQREEGGRRRLCEAQGGRR